jgi:DNA (cytosine-5)-methyltransferase 1
LVAEGYAIGAIVIDAVHFVPQSRPRLFVIAADSTSSTLASVLRDTPNPAWHPEAVIRAYNGLPRAFKETAWRWWDLPTPSQRLATLDDVIELKPQGVEWNTEEDTRRILSMMTDLNRRKVLTAQAADRLKVGTIYRRTRGGIQRAEVRFDGISGCLRTPVGGSSRQTIIVVEGAQVRTRLLSPREAARLMGLPEIYKLPQRYNDAYHLAGDGVVVPVVRYLAANLLEPLLTVREERQKRTA